MVLGIGYHIMQSVRRLRKRFPNLGMGDIFSTFFKEEWDSLFVSVLVLISYQMFIFIVRYNGIPMPAWWDKYLCAYWLALVLGYAGQRLAYKYLSTAEKVLEQKSDEINKQL